MAASGVFALLAIPGAGWLLGIGIAVSLLGMYLLGLARKDDLACWLHYGSFGLNAFAGNHTVNDGSHPFQKAASDWQAHPEQELQALYNLIFAFTATLEIKQRQPGLELSRTNLLNSKKTSRSADRPAASISLVVDMYNYDPDTSELEVNIVVGDGPGGAVETLVNTPEKTVIAAISTREEDVAKGVMRFKFEVDSKALSAGIKFVRVQLLRSEQFKQPVTIPEDRYLVLSGSLKEWAGGGERRDYVV